MALSHKGNRTSRQISQLVVAPNSHPVHWGIRTSEIPPPPPPPLSGVADPEAKARVRVPRIEPVPQWGQRRQVVTVGPEDCAAGRPSGAHPGGGGGRRSDPQKEVRQRTQHDVKSGGQVKAKQSKAPWGESGCASPPLAPDSTRNFCAFPVV